MLRSILRGVVLTSLLWLSPAHAQNTYSAYLDTDARTSTGCTIALPGGTFVGADWRVQATVTPGANPQVTSVTLSQCVGGTFGAGTPVGGGYPVGLGNGTAGSDVVEFSAPTSGLLVSGVESVPLGFTAVSPTGSDVLFGSIGAPLALFFPVPTPALAAWALAAMALLLLLVARRFGRSRLYSRVLAISLVALCGI